MRWTFVGLDHFQQQEETVIVMFESAAMIDQFRYYCKGAVLVPFGGEPTFVICNQVPEEPVALNDIDVAVLVNKCIYWEEV